MRSKVLDMEFMLLETLCFDLAVEQPFKYLKEILISRSISQEISQAAWRILSDWYVLFLTPQHA